MIDWSPCSPWLPCSGHPISFTGPSVSPFRDFFSRKSLFSCNHECQKPILVSVKILNLHYRTADRGFTVCSLWNACCDVIQRRSQLQHKKRSLEYFGGPSRQTLKVDAFWRNSTERIYMNHTGRMCVRLEPRIQLDTVIGWLAKLRKSTTCGKTLGWTTKLCRCSTQNLKFLKLVLLISWMAGVRGCLQCRQAGASRQRQAISR